VLEYLLRLEYQISDHPQLDYMRIYND
jgi:hypothetical protein